MSSGRSLAALAVLALLAACGTGPASDASLECIDVCEGAIVDLDMDTGSSCAVYESGAMYCWGARRGVAEDGRADRAWGPPGPGPFHPVRVPVDARVASVALGRDRSCLLDVRGLTWCWGVIREVDELGSARDVHRLEPYPEAGYWRTVHLAVGTSDRCYTTTEGEALCVGTHLDPGRFGRPTDVVETAVGIHVLCALIADGHVECWGGLNGSGDIGDGTTEIRYFPTRVVGIEDAVEIAAKGYTCARLATGRVRCWGPGPLGDGSFESSPVPVEVIGVEDAVQIDVGYQGAYAIRPDGTVMAWGYLGAPVHGSGEPGSRFAWSYSTAVPVDGIDEAVEVAVGGDAACVVRGSGEVWCWGGGYLTFGVAWDPDIPVWPPARVRGLPCPCAR